MDKGTRELITNYKDYCYIFLRDLIGAQRRRGRGGNELVSEGIITLDTETSKKHNYPETHDNHIVSWSITVRARHQNIVTLTGRKPSECVECIETLLKNIRGQQIIIFVHNLPYDWVFLRQFLFRSFSFPKRQLNIKPHYPLNIQFENGVILRDSLALAQRRLEKWAIDLNTEHQKAVGDWEYEKRRDQTTHITQKEWGYQALDTICLAECIDEMCKQLNKWVATLPMTATGIGREKVRKIAKKHHGHELYERQCLTYEQYKQALNVFHGGFTHANRFLIGETITGDITCHDFASSYPFVMLSEKYPMEKFSNIKDRSVQFILDNADKYAFMFSFCAFKVELKDPMNPAPALQFSKCLRVGNPILDNGRILQADFVIIDLNEIDLKVIASQYHFINSKCLHVQAAEKDYLPRWFTDYVYSTYENKQNFKEGDPVLYNLAKVQVNINYGMCVQKLVKDNIIENYETGENETELKDGLTEFLKQTTSHNAVLPYQWGVWVTSYAFYNLHQLIKCAGTFLYSDTDSVYSVNMDYRKLNVYNERCKQKLRANGYEAVTVYSEKNKCDIDYWLGVAELDKEYTEFRAMGAKRYCGRSKKDQKLHITVAGVPKSGAKCLNNDISNFKQGLVFSGDVTKKLTHEYIFNNKIYIDKWGNETADSIDLTPCDYLLDEIERNPWDLFDYEEVQIEDYESQ